MRQTSLLLVLVVVLLVGSSRAEAQTVTASGMVDWSALTNFTAKSVEVVFDDFFTGERIVVTPTLLGPTTGSYSVTLNAGDLYGASAIVGDCSGDPAECGTTTSAGTHIRFGAQFVQAPDDGSPVTADLIADPSLNPVAVCGAIQVDAGTFIKLSAILETGVPDEDFAVGVFSTAMVAAPASSYCVQAAPFTAPQLASTTTIAQSQIPTCPSQIDVQRVDFLFVGPDPITDDIQIVVPPPPGEIRGTFSVGGFSADGSFVGASTSGISIAPCAGLSSFSANGPGPLSFDFTPALAGPWSVTGGAGSQRVTADGLLLIVRSTSVMIGDGSLTVDVAAGSPAVPSLSYNAAVVSGNVSVDSRRFGGPSSELSPIPLFFGFTQALSLGAEWAPLKEVLLPMQVAERYDVSLDPRGENWLLSGVNGVGYGYQYTVANASVSSAFSDVVTLPNFGGHPPFDQFQMPSLLIGAVAAGAKNPGRSPADRLPRRERHVELPRRRSPSPMVQRYGRPLRAPERCALHSRSARCWPARSTGASPWGGPCFPPVATMARRTSSTRTSVTKSTRGASISSPTTISRLTSVRPCCWAFGRFRARRAARRR